MLILSPHQDIKSVPSSPNQNYSFQIRWNVMNIEEPTVSASRAKETLDTLITKDSQTSRSLLSSSGID